MGGGRWASINMIRPLSQPVGSHPHSIPPRVAESSQPSVSSGSRSPRTRPGRAGDTVPSRLPLLGRAGVPDALHVLLTLPRPRPCSFPPRGVRVTAERCHLSVTCSLDKTMERTQVYRHALWTNIRDLSTQPPSSGKSERGRDTRQMKADHPSEGAATSTGFSLDEARRSLRCPGLRPGA